MTDSIVSSREEFEKRRRRLRWQKRWRIMRLLWRTALAGGIAGGLVWVIAQPNWILRDPEQIEIEGMELLSQETVRSLVPIAYPEPILEIDPEAIAQHLREQGPIDTVAVQRRLFPPSLSVHITERRPVAVLLGNTYDDPFANTVEDSLAAPTPQLSLPSKTAPTGLLDENGNWLPIASYTNVSQDIDLPELRVIGMQASYRQSWKSLYETLRQSPVEVYEVDWYNPANLIINTELGVIHLGSYQPEHFETQMTILDRMRNLPNLLELSTIDYIDLRVPESPVVQFNPGAPQYSQTTLQIPLPEMDDSDVDDSDVDDSDVDDSDVDNGDR